MTDLPLEHERTDWEAFAASLSPVEVIDEPVLVKKRSRDLLVQPGSERTAEEVLWRSGCGAQDRRADAPLPTMAPMGRMCPVTLRGGGTGNYGQAVPLKGGLIIEDHEDEPHPRDRRRLCARRGRGADGRCQRGSDRTGLGNGDVPLDPGHCHYRRLRGRGSAGIGSIANGPCGKRGNIIQLRRDRWKPSRRSMFLTPKRRCRSTRLGAERRHH